MFPGELEAMPSGMRQSLKHKISVSNMRSDGGTKRSSVLASCAGLFADPSTPGGHKMR
jgi:hypothetical protein